MKEISTNEIKTILDQKDEDYVFDYYG